MAIELFDNPATRNRQGITPARSVINHAHERGWCGPISVKLFPVPKSRKHKPVDRTWLDAFLDQCDKDNLPHLAAAVLFMNQTGARASEAANLMGEHVDLPNAAVVLAKTKTAEWHPRYLTAELVARMASLEIADGKKVFGYSHPTSINHRMRKVCKRAQIEYRSPHSAGRHSFATNAMRLGVGIKDAMDAGGWKSAALFMETYVHSDDPGRRVASAFEGKKLAQVPANGLKTK
ncbi:site-specific integrase [Paracoccus alkanivorans]|uniref:Site-specific integrase n=2 Tax=Paracoccus alkanivorans TaxID=2116655 RepID=A0A3M0MIE9_9RHOB|nr:site-specific integrase [Paracoccus alkanivorans]